MKRTLVSFSLVCAAALGFAQSSPRVLIIQTMAPVEDGADFNIVVDVYFASELEANGRLDPIVWSPNDAKLRKAIDERVIPGYAVNPKLEDAFGFASKLGCDYVLTVSALRFGETLMADGKMYRNRREIWKQSGRYIAQSGLEAAFNDNARSVARTWTGLLAQGPLKDIPQRVVVKTPDPDPGTRPINVEPPIPQPPKSDNAALKEQIDKLGQVGSWGAALSLMRDAVDANPVDVERRTMLIDLILRTGKYSEARDEARRSAGLFPTEEAFWIASARCSMALGDNPQAIRDLNEAVARKPESPAIRAALGEAQLAAGRLNFAIEHLDAAIKAAPTPWLHLLRGCARRLQGNEAFAAADFKIAQDGVAGRSDEDVRRAGFFAFLLVSGNATAISNDVRDLIQAARRAPKSPEVKERVAANFSAIQRLLSVALAVEPFTNNPQSQQRATLALRLLGQASTEISAFLASPNEDALSDATISLGEALKTLETAREAYASGS